MLRRGILRLSAACVACMLTGGAGTGAHELELARDGRTPYTILLPADAPEPVRLAASELASYLQRMSGAPFPIGWAGVSGKAIALRISVPSAADSGAAGDRYSIAVRGDSLVLTGGSARAVLYAAYDLLERLGCQWLAPDFAFYQGEAEVVPRHRHLTYRVTGDVVERPVFAMRELDVGQGTSHDVESMRRLIAWLPKLRFNQLQVPMTMGARATWDDWRTALAPELERRGITLEVGGHGYQNFLNAGMEGGRLFELHPDWFGLDASCAPTRSPDVVFNTANPAAVAYLIGNVVRYVREHPEIDIFEFWPPDVARWSECPKQRRLGSPQDRQARLVNQVRAAVRTVRPDLRLQVIAYQDALDPPQGTPLASDVLVDFCPIDQSFDAPINDRSQANNRYYRETLEAWRRVFDGDIGVYTYYRKYAWRSLPVVLPALIQQDLRYYASVPVQGVSMYAEPADWFTYELNYLAFGTLAWNPEADLAALRERQARARFGEAWQSAAAALAMLEDEYRLRGSVPFSSPEPLPLLAEARARLASHQATVRAAAGRLDGTDAVARANLERLALMLELGIRDVEVQAARTRGEAVGPLLADMVALMHEHAGAGVFLARADDLARLEKHYTRESQVLQPVVQLARGGRTEHVISLGASPSPAERLAAAELAAYLRRITGATFPVVQGDAAVPAIVLRQGRSYATSHIAGEAYALAVREGSIYITGGTGRAVLYGAYDLLERLGCRWLAPSLDFYQGGHEHVPAKPDLKFAAERDVIERPAHALRKLDVEEGLSHDEASLRAIVAWMPKLRFNTLQVPLDYGGSGRVRWDAWRAALTPELDRRELLIEVGGHGYQNFLNADMEDGRLFEQHPEWFGRDSECRPSRAPHLVFDTENPAAVEYLVANLLRYLSAHPEIDIFDFWPPDGARWAECAGWADKGTPADRQARLVNRVAAAARVARPDVRLEMIAYAHAKDPPQTVALDRGVLVDFCPIGQNFYAAIDDPAGGNNATYVSALRAWRADFTGDLGLYSYYRKYAWRSLPVLLPRYLQHDLQWYATLPVAAVSTYAEPGDWGTYELNHYALGKLAWQPDLSLEALLDDYFPARYGKGAEAAAAAARALEARVRVHGSIPYSRASTPSAIREARAELLARQRDVQRAEGEPAALRRLALMLEFAVRDLGLQERRAAGEPPQALAAEVTSLVEFLQAHAAEGVFLLTGRDDLDRYRRHYGVLVPMP